MRRTVLGIANYSGNSLKGVILWIIWGSIIGAIEGILGV